MADDPVKSSRSHYRNTIEIQRNESAVYCVCRGKSLPYSSMHLILSDVLPASSVVFFSLCGYLSCSIPAKCELNGVTFLMDCTLRPSYVRWETRIIIFSQGSDNVSAVLGMVALQA